MSRGLAESGRVTALGLAVLVVLSILAVPVLAQTLTTSPAPAATDTDAVVTPTLPPVNLTATPTPTPTSTDLEEPPQGNASTLVVDDDVGAGGVGSDAECPDAEHESIQDAVDEASKGHTVVVCAGGYESVEIETANLTLRAHGDAEITSTLKPAVRTTTPRVTIPGSP